jgi:hypothetical protein
VSAIAQRSISNVTTDAIALARIERKLDRLLDPDGAALAALLPELRKGLPTYGIFVIEELFEGAPYEPALGAIFGTRSARAWGKLFAQRGAPAIGAAGRRRSDSLASEPL